MVYISYYYHNCVNYQHHTLLGSIVFLLYKHFSECQFHGSILQWHKNVVDHYITKVNVTMKKGEEISN